jgi:predicted nucleic acid-binding protein
MSARLEFVDTNILLYAYDHSEPIKQARAQALLEDLWQRREGCLSVQVLQEFYVNATRKLSRPLSPDIARQAVDDYTPWIIHMPTPRDVLAAIDLHQAHQVSFWDAMVLRSARELGCLLVWSEDLNPGQRFETLEVRNPL